MRVQNSETVLLQNAQRPSAAYDCWVHLFCTSCPPMIRSDQIRSDRDLIATSPTAEKVCGFDRANTRPMFCFSLFCLTCNSRCACGGMTTAETISHPQICGGNRGPARHLLREEPGRCPADSSANSHANSRADARPIPTPIAREHVRVRVFSACVRGCVHVHKRLYGRIFHHPPKKSGAFCPQMHRC